MAAHISHVAPISAIAQSVSNYKALVCIFLFGGNDSNNLIAPIDSRDGAYQSMRGPVAMAPGALLPAGGSGYGLWRSCEPDSSESARSQLRVGSESVEAA